MSKNLPDLVIREVTNGIWTFSRPFARYGLVPFGGRSTAIRLVDGNVWVLASTPLTEDTKTTIDKLGPVKWIIAPDVVHHLFLGEFKKAYPDAKVIGVDGLAEKKKEEGLQLDGAYGVDPADTKYGYEDEIKACYFSGFKNKDVAFLHTTSKTLLVADLLFNLPPKEQYSKSSSWSTVPWVSANFNPYKPFHQKTVLDLGLDKAAMKRDAQTVSEWDFERIIMCHGDVIETEGNKAWKAAYSKYFSSSL